MSKWNKIVQFFVQFFLFRCRLNRLFPFNLVSLHAMQVTETHLELSICSSHMSSLIPWHLFLSFHGKPSNLYCNILKCRTLESGNTLNSHRKFPRNFRLQQCWWKSPQRCCDTGQCFQYHKHVTDCSNSYVIDFSWSRAVPKANRPEFYWVLIQKIFETFALSL